MEQCLGLFDTAAYLATRIAGAPPLHRGNAPPPVGFAEIKALQAGLSHAGFDVGARFLSDRRAFGAHAGRALTRRQKSRSWKCQAQEQPAAKS
jgi:hypothetical protein